MTSAKPALDRPAETACVLNVDGGRGFIINHNERRLVVTAGHCLPSLPPAHAAACLEDRTFAGILASLDGSKNGIWAVCLFVDPVADIAVLGCPDDQTFFEEFDAYNDLTENAPFLQIGKAESGQGYVLSLGGEWVRTELQVFSGMGGSSLSIDPTEAGQSGSPILNDAGQAVGVIVIGTETGESGKRINQRSGPQPILMRNLPGWLL
jgi:hypothetical protein